MNRKDLIITIVLLVAAVLLLINLFPIGPRSKGNLIEEVGTGKLLLKNFVINSEAISISKNAEVAPIIERLVGDGSHLVASEVRYSENGKFFYLYGVGEKNGRATKIAIPLDPGPDTQTGVFESATGCIHRCDQGENEPCVSCNLIINEKCKQQTCNCSDGKGACSAGIVFLR